MTRFGESVLAKALVALIACPATAMGYAPRTHETMSQVAVSRSALGSSRLYVEWGLKKNIDTMLFPRNGTPADTRTAAEHVAAGSVEEDAFPRPAAHFYDPVHNRPLLPLIYGAIGRKSPDWSIEGLGQSDPNDYSFARARKAMQRAFIAPTESERNQNFGLMFEAVGRVIHHIQDMAQPQHVRHDSHFEMPWADVLPDMEIPPENRSRYERATDRGRERNALAYSGYDNVNLGAARDYWETADRKGLAQFTNANFVSQGRNSIFQMLNGAVAPGAEYSSPVPSLIVHERIEYALQQAGACPMPTEEVPNPVSGDPKCSLVGEMDFVGNDVVDNLRPQLGLFNGRAAAHSIWDQDLKDLNQTIEQVNSGGATVTVDRQFTLNSLTYPSAWELLIPRAVGYSSGMIDYFFRGKIDLVRSSTMGLFEFKNLGDETLNGFMQLYYDDENDVRRTVGVPIPINNLAPGGARGGIPIPPYGGPTPKDVGVYTMVFTGTMGNEGPIGDSPGAVVAKQVKIPVPEFYWASNSGGGAQPWSFRLSFSLPADLDTLHQQYFTSAYTSLRINGTAAAQGVVVPGGCGPVGGPMASHIQGTLGGVSWAAMHYLNNRVWYANAAGSDTWIGSAAEFQAFRAANPNFYPVCSTQVFVTNLPPNGKVYVEYLVGSQLMFTFCARLEDNPPGVTPAPFGNRRLRMSFLQNARVHDQAVAVMRENTVGSCP